MSKDNNVKMNNEDEIRGYSKRYMLFLIVILGLAHVLDEYTSIAPSLIQSSIVQEFFLDYGITETVALQTMAALGIVTVLLMFFANFFKGLQDKFGRKKIFLISAVGMTLGVLTQSMATSFAMYFIGQTIAFFFIFNDMQYVYINEETPSNKRAQAFTTAKIIGLSAIFLVPIIRGMFISEEVENWRPVLYFPVLIGVIVIIFSALFLKESRSYVILEKDRELNPEKYIEETISLRQAFKDLKKMPTWSQVKWVIAVMAITGPFQVLNMQYSEMFMDQLGILHANRNIVMMLSVLGTGIAYLLQGQIADRLGRKPSNIINAIAVIVLVPVEYVALVNGELIVAGLCQGIRIGAFWNITDTNRFILIENVPTRLRGYAQTIGGLLMFIFLPIAIIVIGVLLDVFTYTYDILLYFGLPFVIVSLFIMIFKLKETLHVDIDKIEG